MKPFQIPAGRVAGVDLARSTSNEVSLAETGESSLVVQPAPVEEPTAGVERPAVELLKSPPRDVSPTKATALAERFNGKDSIAVSVDAMPVRNFINYLFGELLKVNYVVVDGVPGLEQTITLNTQNAVSSRQLFRLATDMLGSKGLSISFKQGVYLIGPSSGKSSGDIPLGFGVRPEDVPDLPGNILQIIPLKYGQNTALERAAAQFTDAQIALDLQQNALFATGTRETVLRLLELVRLLDQPSVRTSRLGLIRLTFVPVKEFIEQVSVLLENEGISVATGRSPDGKGVVLVPIEQLGGVVVFAVNPTVLERVEFWVAQLDRAGEGNASRYFVYRPRNANPIELGETLAALLAPQQKPDQQALGNLSRDTRSALGASASQPLMRRDAARSGAAAVTAQPTSFVVDGLSMSVDPRSNTLVFYTSGPRYESLLPLIRQLDIAPKQILLEATIAEVALTGEFAYGVEFGLTRDVGTQIPETGRGVDTITGGTLGLLNLPGGTLGLNYVTNVTDQIKLRLQSNDSRVNVLSSPFLLVRDGVPATITVGNDVPTVGASSSDPVLSERTVTSIAYRRTGLSLQITPKINASDTVLLQISQSISNSVPGSAIDGAPVFFDRQLETEVVARSGQTVVLAGLISESQSDASTNVPWFSRVPILGAAFRSDSRKKEKTELLLLLTPRVIESPDEWPSVRAGIERAMQYLQVEPSRVPE